MADDYIPPALSVLADELAEQSITELATTTGWTPEADSPMRHLLRAKALGDAFINTSALDQTDRFTEFVGTAFGRPQRDAVAAQVLGTITASNTLGHTVSPGDVYMFDNGDGVQQLVTVAIGATIAPAASSTVAGAVKFTFENAGAGFNGLTGSLTLVSPRATWFLSGVTASPVVGGVDAEGGVEYRDKVALHLRQISPRPITAEDWESAVVDCDASIARCMVIETFDPTDTTGGASGTVKAGHFVVVPAKADGTAVGVDAKAAINAIPLLSDVVLHIVDPTLSLVNITETVVRKAEYTSAETQAATVAAIRAWADPAAWGSDVTGEQASWHLEPKVRIKQVEAVSTNAQPVAYVSGSVAVTLQIQGVGSPQTTDLSLPGLAPLAKANTVTVTVLDPA